MDSTHAFIYIGSAPRAQPSNQHLLPHTFLSCIPLLKQHQHLCQKQLHPQKDRGMPHINTTRDAIAQQESTRYCLWVIACIYNSVQICNNQAWSKASISTKCNCPEGSACELCMDLSLHTLTTHILYLCVYERSFPVSWNSRGAEIWPFHYAFIITAAW
jgi:hypothetical protein